jgi:hypothetical protein
MNAKLCSVSFFSLFILVFFFFLGALHMIVKPEFYRLLLLQSCKSMKSVSGLARLACRESLLSVTSI